VLVRGVTRGDGTTGEDVDAQYQDDPFDSVADRGKRFEEGQA